MSYQRNSIGYNTQRISTFLLSTILIFVTSISAYAKTNDISTQQEEKESVAVSVTSGELSESNWVKIGTISDREGTRGYSGLYTTIHRNGTSKECQIYLHWAGADPYNAWKFSKVVVDNGSL